MSLTDCFTASLNEHYTDTGGFSDHVFAMCRSAGLPLCAAHSRPEGKTALSIAGHDCAA